jgi:hypothetical protein
MSLARTLLGVIDQPTRAMREAAERPRSWWLPALLLVVGTIALAWVSAPYQMELANERSAQMIERVTANMPEEQAEMVRERSQQLTLPQYWLGTAGVGLVLAALGWAIRGAVIHFSSMALGGTSAWGSTFAIGVWGMLPFFVRDLVRATFVWVNEQAIEHEGLSFLVASGDLLEDSTNLVYALLANVDPFALWHVVLLGIGISAATRLSRLKAALLALVVLALSVAVKLLPVAVGAAVGGRFLG